MSPVVVVVASRLLYAYAKEHTVRFNWDTGPYRSVTAGLSVGGNAREVLNFYEWRQGRDVFAINFEYVTGYATPEPLVRLADRLRAIPSFSEYLVDLEQADFRKLPTLPIDPLLAQLGAVAVIGCRAIEIREFEAT